jgi:hypothetical protein
MKRFAQIGWGVLFLIVLGAWPVLAAAQPDAEGISGDIFGRSSGIVHPFLEISETYTDNMTNASENEESDFITDIVPGIALAFPGTGSTDVRFTSSTAAPGGLTLSRQKLVTNRRFQGIAIYSPEIKMYGDNSDQNFTAQRATGAFQYNAPGGLTVDIADKYQHAQDTWGETGGLGHETYDNNVANAIVELAVLPKISLSGGGSYHSLAYKHDISEFRDRNDRVYSGALNFHASSKTKLFCEYKRVDIMYKEDISANRESTGDYVYGGMSWDMTAKSQGLCKLGYVSKDFDESGIDDPSTWTAEANISHQFTDRTMVTIGAIRDYYESNLATSGYYTTNRVNLTYGQALTSKLTGNILLSYQNDDYDNIELENDTYSVQPGINFSPYRWLTCRLAYTYSDRNSDDDSWEYSTNEFTFSAKASF